LFYKIEDRNRHSMHIFRAVMDHPYFSLHSPNTTSRIVSVRDGDVFSVVDRNAIVLWKLVDGVRTAWLYEGSTKRTGGVVKEFEKIGCVMSSINDDDGQLLFRILQVSKKH
uniref:Uncharacterized protein n=1 Tax=Parascaris univalens TaxID=6257 RepID=A0A915A0I7_PARUN